MNKSLLKEDDIIMRLDEDNVLVSVESRDAEELNLTGCDIKGIGPEACKDMKKLSRVIIPEGIVEIGERAFYGCPIEELAIPHSLIKVGPDAFVGIRTHKVQYAGTECDFFTIINSSGFDIFGKSVIVECENGDLSYGPLNYGK